MTIFGGSGLIILALGHAISIPNPFGFIVIIAGMIFSQIVEDYKTKQKYHSLRGVVIYISKIIMGLVFLVIFLNIMFGIMEGLMDLIFPE